jgi:nucleotide-binding universal stress UspA family protein
LITGMVVLLLACAAATQALGVHIVLGAFAAGVILSQTPVINHKVVRPLEIVTMAFFAPVFFASSGLNVNLSSLLEPKLCAITALLSLATLVVKLTSCVGAGRVAGYGLWESLAVGVGANTKGSLGLILAMLGLSLDIISQDMYAVIIFIALFSTGVSAPLMKYTMGKVKITPDEIEKMKREERRSRTILSSIRRVLWPTSGRGRNAFIAKLLNSIGQSQVVETTALWVKHPAGASEKPFKSIKSVVNRKLVSVFENTVTSTDPMKVISEEGNRGYDLIVMATDEPPGDAEYVFGQLVDGVILNTSTRVLVVYEPDSTSQRDIKEVLIPVSGNEQSIAAAEFGISLAKSLNAKVFCLCIQESEANDLYSEATQSGKQIERNVTNEITTTLQELATALDVEFKSILVQTSSHPAQAAILTAQQHDIDLIVLGAEPKIGKGLFIGHTINYVLRHPPCAVAVLKIQG